MRMVTIIPCSLRVQLAVALRSNKSLFAVLLKAGLVDVVLDLLRVVVAADRSDVEPGRHGPPVLPLSDGQLLPPPPSAVASLLTLVRLMVEHTELVRMEVASCTDGARSALALVLRVMTRHRFGDDPRVRAEASRLVALCVWDVVPRDEPGWRSEHDDVNDEATIESTAAAGAVDVSHPLAHARIRIEAMSTCLAPSLADRVVLPAPVFAATRLSDMRLRRLETVMVDDEALRACWSLAYFRGVGRLLEWHERRRETPGLPDDYTARFPHLLPSSKGIMLLRSLDPEWQVGSALRNTEGSATHATVARVLFLLESFCTGGPALIARLGAVPWVPAFTRYLTIVPSSPQNAAVLARVLRFIRTVLLTHDPCLERGIGDLVHVVCARLVPLLEKGSALAAACRNDSVDDDEALLYRDLEVEILSLLKTAMIGRPSLVDATQLPGLMRIVGPRTQLVYDEPDNVYDLHLLTLALQCMTHLTARYALTSVEQTTESTAATTMGLESTSSTLSAPPHSRAPGLSVTEMLDMTKDLVQVINTSFSGERLPDSYIGKAVYREAILCLRHVAAWVATRGPHQGVASQAPFCGPHWLSEGSLTWIGPLVHDRDHVVRASVHNLMAALATEERVHALLARIHVGDMTLLDAVSLAIFDPQECGVVRAAAVDVLTSMVTTASGNAVLFPRLHRSPDAERSYHITQTSADHVTSWFLQRHFFDALAKTLSPASRSRPMTSGTRDGGHGLLLLDDRPTRQHISPPILSSTLAIIGSVSRLLSRLLLRDPATVIAAISAADIWPPLLQAAVALLKSPPQQRCPSNDVHDLLKLVALAQAGSTVRASGTGCVCVGEVLVDQTPVVDVLLTVLQRVSTEEAPGSSDVSIRALSLLGSLARTAKAPNAVLARIDADWHVVDAAVAVMSTFSPATVTAALQFIGDMTQAARDCGSAAMFDLPLGGEGSSHADGAVITWGGRFAECMLRVLGIVTKPVSEARAPGSTSSAAISCLGESVLAVLLAVSSSARATALVGGLLEWLPGRLTDSHVRLCVLSLAVSPVVRSGAEEHESASTAIVGEMARGLALASSILVSPAAKETLLATPLMAALETILGVCLNHPVLTVSFARVVAAWTHLCPQAARAFCDAGPGHHSVVRRLARHARELVQSGRATRPLEPLLAVLSSLAMVSESRVHMLKEGILEACWTAVRERRSAMVASCLSFIKYLAFSKDAHAAIFRQPELLVDLADLLGDAVHAEIAMGLLRNL